MTPPLWWIARDSKASTSSICSSMSSPTRTPPSDITISRMCSFAVEEQLGLKLEERKESFDIIVVDHMEKPSEN